MEHAADGELDGKRLRETLNRLFRDAGYAEAGLVKLVDAYERELAEKELLLAEHAKALAENRRLSAEHEQTKRDIRKLRDENRLRAEAAMSSRLRDALRE